MTPDDPRTLAAFRRVRALLAAYLTLSVAAVVVAVLLRHRASMVNDAVWIRSSIVVASALLTLAFAARAARGSTGAYRRLRLVATVMVVAIAVIVATPGPFPLWLKLEQTACGALLLAVVVTLNARTVKARFAAARELAGER